MLHHGRYDTGLFAVQNHIRPDTLENRVVSFGGAAVDNDVIFVYGTDPRIYTINGDTHLGMGFGTELMQGIGVTILLQPIRFHRLFHPGIQDCGGVIVKIYSTHN